MTADAHSSPYLQPRAREVEQAIMRLDATLASIAPTLAIKKDVADAEGRIIKWIIGSIGAAVIGAITVGTFVLNNAGPKAAPQPSLVIVFTKAVDPNERRSTGSTPTRAQPH